MGWMMRRSLRPLLKYANTLGAREAAAYLTFQHRRPAADDLKRRRADDDQGRRQIARSEIHDADR